MQKKNYLNKQLLVAVGHTLRQVQEGIDKVPHIVLFSGGKDVLQVLGNGRTAFAAFFWYGLMP